MSSNTVAAELPLLPTPRQARRRGRGGGRGGGWGPQRHTHAFIATADKEDLEEALLDRRRLVAHLQPVLEVRPQQAVPFAVLDRLGWFQAHTDRAVGLVRLRTGCTAPLVRIDVGPKRDELLKYATSERFLSIA